MIFAILSIFAIVCMCRLFIDFLWEVDEHGNIKINAWVFAAVTTGIIFSILGQVMK